MAARRHHAPAQGAALVLTLAWIASGCEPLTEPEAATAHADTAVVLPEAAAEPATSLSAEAPNSPPLALADAYATTAGVPLAIEAPGLIANDLDPDGDAIVVTSFTPPSNGTLTRIVTTGAFTYEPDPDFTGSDAFTYRIRDALGNLSEPVEVGIDVLPDPNRGPLAVPDFYATFVGVPLEVEAPGLEANDLDLDGDDIVVTSFTPPANGTLTRIVTTGAFTYEPDPGFTGSDAFTYRIRDALSNLSDPVEVTIEVLAPGGENPVAVPDAWATTEGTPLALEAPGLLANDLDPNGDAIVVTSFNPPANGTLTRIVTTGAFTYEPDPGFTGSDAFSYRIRDALSNVSEPVEVAITVTAPDRTPPEIVVSEGPLVLWPPNHRSHRIRVDDLVDAVLDEGDPDVTIEDVVIVRATSDEPDDGEDDGNTVDDVVLGAGCRVVDLRAERQGMGNGRVYVVELAVTDASGNVGSASVEVHVPVDRRAGAVRDAPVLVVDGACPLA
jgi:hypothetical protein